jgi:hypothetical protein
MPSAASKKTAKKNHSTTTLYPPANFLQSHSRTLISITGVALTVGAFLGLISTYPQVLGATSTSQLQAYPTPETSPPPQYQETIRERITYWQQIVDSQPTYRDAYVQLAGLYYQLGDQSQVQALLDQVKSLDPNWEHLDQVTQALKQP